MNDPVIAFLDHRHDHLDDNFTFVVKLDTNTTLEIFALDSKLNPSLGFGSFAFRIGKLADEVIPISAFPPSFGKVCTDGSRRSPQLIRQRKLFVLRKGLRMLENPHCDFESALVNIEFEMGSNRA